MQNLMKQWIAMMGDDPEREGLRRTPERTAEAWSFLTRGYQQDPAALLNSSMFEVEANHMVIVRDIEIYSICEHHLLPFFGTCHIGYIPRGKVVGVSKLARLADLFARRLQVQERLTTQIADALVEHLGARGVMVVVEAEHTCMTMRGVRKPGSSTVTSAVRGQLRDAATRAEAMSLILGR